MIKTLRITGFLAAIAAIGLFVFSVFFGLRPDEQIEDFLRSGTVLGEFKQSHGKRRRGKNQSSPLVDQAWILAEIINPTPKPPPPPRKGGVAKVDGPGEKPPPPPPPPPSSVTFEVFGVSYYPSRPEESLAWIVAKSKQKRWARQGEVISHWTISKITEDKVTVTSGDRSADLIVKRPPEKSLLSKDNAKSDTGIKVISTVSSVSESPVPGSVKGTSAVAGGVNVKPPAPGQKDPGQNAASMQSLFNALAGGGNAPNDVGGSSGVDPRLMGALMEYMKNPDGQPSVPGDKSNKIDSKPKDVTVGGEVGIDKVDAKESKKIKDIGKEMKKDDRVSDPRRRALRNVNNGRRKRLSREAMEKLRRRDQERKEP
ncbi:MAG: hypothetical protein ACYSWP_07825 [Planctomycetota bacterium]|jgi:hypothetical protein